MIKFGTLVDYRNAKKLLKENRYVIKENKSNSRIRRLYVGNVLVLSIFHLGGKSWGFNYNEEFWVESV